MEFKSQLELYDHRVEAIKHAALCHNYLRGRYYGFAVILTIVAVCAQVIKILWSIFDIPDLRITLTLDAIVAICGLIYKATKLSTLHTQHQASYIGAMDMLDDMAFRRIRAQRSEEDMTNALRDIGNKIFTYRVTEPIIPMWVKEKYVIKI